MAELPKKSIVDRINLTIIQDRLPRPHLGASVLGHPCERFLVYSFRWAFREKIEAKSNRIFRLGDATEELIVQDLNRIGMQVTNIQDQITGYMGHAGGSIDGIINGAILFEAKSMNQSNYQDMVKKKLEMSKPQHFSQAQRYMGALDLKEGLYVAMNKNTCDLYVEEVEFCQDTYDRLIEKEVNIIEADFLPIGVSTNSSWYHCKFCSAREVCHFGSMPEKNCRTCVYSEIKDQGMWKCSLKDKLLTLEEQAEGCSNWYIAELFYAP